MTTIHIDPRTPDVDKLVQSLAEMVRDAPVDASVTIDRDTVRALVGAYKLVTSALDDLGEAVRDYRSRAAEADDGFELLDEVLADHGIELADRSGGAS